MKIKVDYSLKVKKTGIHNCPGEFAIYTKKNIFSEWVECSTYADFKMACLDAHRMRIEYINVPKYF